MTRKGDHIYDEESDELKLFAHHQHYQEGSDDHGQILPCCTQYFPPWIMTPVHCFVVVQSWWCISSCSSVGYLHLIIRL